WRELARELRRLVRRCREHDGLRATQHGFAGARPHDGPRSVAVALDAAPLYACLDAADSTGQCVGERLHSRAERKAARGIFCGLAALLARARPEDLTLEQTAILLFERMKTRKSGRHRYLLGISGIDARHERVDRVGEGLVGA